MKQEGVGTVLEDERERAQGRDSLKGGQTAGQDTATKQGSGFSPS